MKDRVSTLVPGNWRGAARLAGFIVLVAAVAVFLVALFPTLVGADQTYVVQSDSMSPAIDAGAVVFVSEAPTEQIQQGDVITFETGEDPVTHRVVEVSTEGGERRFVTQGDANVTPDPEPVSAADVIGRVSFNVPLMGYVISFAQTDLGLVALVIVPAALLLALEIRDIWRATGNDSADGEGEP